MYRQLFLMGSLLLLQLREIFGVFHQVIPVADGALFHQQLKLRRLLL